eukprot:NODE_1065_length_1132_cov_274.112650_g813_i0.p1 GENE.NODE_1065_length_1132_cov_274.112650_g813_i0~~NODE_1065_length_1132_cov_274.112650_g813_i0.p1  ORF type:complete len:355 (+),score=48.84 NODE_1065_length_1132_cov_274.112650_g813_i0:33-1097(+)
MGMLFFCLLCTFLVLVHPIFTETRPQLTCPAEPIPSSAILKKYASSIRSCDGRGLWSAYGPKEHRYFAGIVALLMNVQRGHYVFDWGSGCGHKQTWLHEKFGTIGYGVEAHRDPAMWAQKHSNLTTCHADGTKLEWIPTGYFDRAFSFGGLYTLPNVCSVSRDLLSKVRPGGTIVYCYMRERKPSTITRWEACFRSAGYNVSAIAPLDRELYPTHISRRYGAKRNHYSLIFRSFSTQQPSAKFRKMPIENQFFVLTSESFQGWVYFSTEKADDSSWKWSKQGTKKICLRVPLNTEAAVQTGQQQQQQPCLMQQVGYYANDFGWFMAPSMMIAGGPTTLEEFNALQTDKRIIEPL